MEIANKVVATDKDELQPVVPTSVRRSSVPDPESTRGAHGSKSGLRNTAEKEAGIAEIKEIENEKEEEVAVEEKVFSREDEPVIRGTIVITVFKDHPYDVEFSGDITGTERDLAWRAMMKGYHVWKNKIMKKQEQKTKAAEAVKNKEKEDARN